MADDKLRVAPTPIPVLHRADILGLLKNVSAAIENGDISANAIVIVTRDRAIQREDGEDLQHSSVTIWSRGDGAEWVDDVVGLLFAGIRDISPKPDE